MMLDDFMIRAGLAGVAVAFAAGPVGCFVVWRRMAYFGDATAHAAILGVALSLAFSISVFWGVLAAALVTALAVVILSGHKLAADTLLGVIAHGSIAVGLVAVAMVSSRSINIESYLFGDILAVSKSDLALIWIGSLAVIGLLIWRWSGLLVSTLNTDMAAASGVRPAREQLVLTLALAVLVAISIKVVGALLITAMLIIPAAAARPLARSPEVMAGLAVSVGVISVLAGLWISYSYDLPSGPTIVTTAVAFFAVSVFARPV